MSVPKVVEITYIKAFPRNDCARNMLKEKSRVCQGLIYAKILPLSLHTNSFFEEFPRVPLATLLFAIHYFVSEDSQRQTARRLSLNPGLVSKIYRRLQDVCSRDLDQRPFIPFGGPGAVVKCDESKFNHKAKVRSLVES